MISFRVDDMTCGHCTAAITKALRAIDPGARVQVDLATHRVDIESSSADVSRLRGAIEDAGYPAMLVEGVPRAPSALAQPRAGCCCG